MLLHLTDRKNKFLIIISFVIATIQYTVYVIRRYKVYGWKVGNNWSSHSPKTCRSGELDVAHSCRCDCWERFHSPIILQ